MDISEHSLTRLRGQLARGELVLFTGAGFSCAAKSRVGDQLPSTRDLKANLWELCFPDSKLDDESTLGDLFGVAKRKRPTQLAELLESSLSVDVDTLPEFYGLYFAYPWHKVYTLNVDDMAAAVTRRFNIDRELATISATAPRSDACAPASRRKVLQVVHLNGVLGDPLEQLTFSEVQYARRIASKEPWYAHCVADVTTRPTVFIGTELREPPLWEHLELRRRRTSSSRDLRPTSILVTPSLNLARRELLKELRVDWVEGTAESFAENVLAKLANEAHHGWTYLQQQDRLAGRISIPLVSDLAVQNPKLDTEYLMGSEPHWSDLLQERAIERANDESLFEQASSILGGEDEHTALAITGTAGTGKSTALMRLALRLSSEGTTVLWIDRDSEVAPKLIRETVRDTEGPLALMIDDGDLYGRQLASLVRDLVPARDALLFGFAARSSKMDRIMSAMPGAELVSIKEHTVPHLADTDIDKLIETLDRHNRLGKLKGRPVTERRRAFAEQAGRQLLVAMIDATSDRRFEEKAEHELVELDGMQRFVYSLVSVAGSLRFYLTKSDIVVATGDDASQALAGLDRLVGRHLLISRPPHYNVAPRHRVVANVVMECLRERGEVGAIMRALAFAAASNVSPTESRTNRAWRLVVALLSHSFLIRVLGVDHSRSVFEEVENLLSFDYHYWLQRGSLEVEGGDVRLAENFLNQARSLAPDDYRVETEYAYMLIRRAYEAPGRADASSGFEEGMEMLERVIAERGDQDPYPFHVLGSQGLSWSRRAELGREERNRLLERLLDRVEQGKRGHPLEGRLAKLYKDLKKEQLMTTVVR